MSTLALMGACLAALCVWFMYRLGVRRDRLNMGCLFLLVGLIAAWATIVTGVVMLWKLAV